jgi:lipocalin
MPGINIWTVGKARPNKSNSALVKVQSINLDNYIGTGLNKREKVWHQVAAFPAWFQRGLSKVTAEYTMMDGYIEVKNAGTRSDGTRKIQMGKAFPSDKKNTLLVQFFWLQPKADYIIEFVDQNYQYAIVGSSSKRYLWILARGEVTPSIYQELVSIANRKGYDVQRLES